jgi:hypothetical protein
VRRCKRDGAVSVEGETGGLEELGEDGEVDGGGERGDAGEVGDSVVFCNGERGRGRWGSFQRAMVGWLVGWSVSCAVPIPSMRLWVKEDDRL